MKSSPHRMQLAHTLCWLVFYSAASVYAASPPEPVDDVPKSNSSKSLASRQFVLKPDQELDVSYVIAFHGQCNLRVSTDYLVIELPDHHMTIVSQAPSWDVKVISPTRKLVGTCKFDEWVRRGSPFNFLKVTSIPEWPLIKVDNARFHDWSAEHYALPYKTQRGTAVPLIKGRVGDFIVLGEGVIPKQACQIVATLIQTPKKASGLPVSLNLWDTDKSSTKLNPVFLFSGVKRNGPKEVEARTVALTKRKMLPSSQGYKVCKDTRDVWVSHADTEGFEGLMR